MPESLDLSLGAMIDQLRELRTERLGVEETVKAMKSGEHAIRLLIIEKLKAAGLGRGTGETATASITRSTEPRVTDWDAVRAYVARTEAWDLFERRISKSAFREILDMGESVPGIEPVPVEDLSLTSLRKA